MQKLKTIIFVLLVAVGAVAQTAPAAYRVQDIVFNGVGGLAGGASISVCTNSAPGLGCTSQVTIYQTSLGAGGAVATNPVTADSLGNYSFYAIPGCYKTVTTYGAGVPVERPDLCVGGIFLSITIGGSQLLSGVQGSTGTKLAACTGTMTSGNLRSTDANGNCVDSGLVVASVGYKPTVVLQRGSGGGAYAGAGDTNYHDVDATNLGYTVTIPVGWKLIVNASGECTTNTASAYCYVSLYDGATIAETRYYASTSGAYGTWALNWVITGDGNSHTVKLQYKTSNASDVAFIENSGTLIPTMVFTLAQAN